MILDEIVNNRRRLLEKEKKFLTIDEIRKETELLLKNNYRPMDFLRNYDANHPFLIAEIKKKSPSKGIIRRDFSISEIASVYKASPRVCAISVLTEPDYFEGQYDYIKQTKEISNKPVLMKDFIIDEYQVYKGYIEGASAILLIAAILKDSEIDKLAKLASELNINVLFETHTASEYRYALNSDFGIIGINNRDLKTFLTSINTSIEILDSEGKPEDRIIISESGIGSGDDIRILYNNGVNGFLIGETFMKERNINKAIEDLFGHYNG